MKAREILQLHEIEALIQELIEKDGDLNILKTEVRNIFHAVQKLQDRPPSNRTSTCSSTVDNSTTPGLNITQPLVKTFLTNTTCSVTSNLNNSTTSFSKLVQSEQCCGHRCIPGRGDHNRPPDQSQCCYHRCRTFRHYISKKP